MLTKKDAPWIDYLDVVEGTGERVLKNDAPDEVKKAYESYLKKIQEHNKNGTRIPK